MKCIPLLNTIFIVQPDTKKSPQEVLDHLLNKDRFSRWMGLQIDEIRLGYCKLHFLVTNEMLNGLDMIHGGILFSAADSAFAFACNSYGIITLALEVNINFIKSVKAGEILTVEAVEIHFGSKIGIYDIRTINNLGELISLFKGTAYRTSKVIE